MDSSAARTVNNTVIRTMGTALEVVSPAPTAVRHQVRSINLLASKHIRAHTHRLHLRNPTARHPTVKAHMVVVVVVALPHSNLVGRTRALHTQVLKVMVLNRRAKVNHMVIQITEASMTKAHPLTNRPTEVVQVSSSMEVARRVNTHHMHQVSSNMHLHHSKVAMDSKVDKAKPVMASTAGKVNIHPRVRAMDNDLNNMVTRRTASSHRKVMVDKDPTAVAVEHRSLVGSVIRCNICGGGFHMEHLLELGEESHVR